MGSGDAMIGPGSMSAATAAPSPLAPSRLAPMIQRTRHRIAPFRLLRPAGFGEARSLLDAWPGAMPVAGGIDLVNQMKEGADPGTLVWLGAIPDADVVRREGGDLLIGACCRHDQIAGDAALQEGFPDLAAAWNRIANSRIRGQGTVAGNLMAQNPGYESAILLSAVAAQLSFLAPGGHGSSAAVCQLGDERGGLRPRPGLVTHLRVRGGTPGRPRRLLYDRTLRPALSVALGLDLDGGHILAARAVLGGCHPVPVLRTLPLAGLALPDLEGRAKDIAREAFADLPPCLVPWRGVAGYRERVGPILLQRLLAEAAR